MIPFIDADSSSRSMIPLQICSMRCSLILPHEPNLRLILALSTPLPFDAVASQVVGCKDTIAQSYLMDCLIQVFPDEFHLASLQAFLDGVCRLKEKVRVRPVLESLMERIGNYVEEHPDTLPRDVSRRLYIGVGHRYGCHGCLLYSCSNTVGVYQSLICTLHHYN